MCGVTVAVNPRAPVPKYCGNVCQRKGYNQSSEGKAARERYNQSPEGKAAKARYRASPKGKAVAKRHMARYNQSPGAKEAQKRRRRQSPKYKAAMRRRSARAVADLRDAYVARHLGLRVAEAPPELIELKRQQLTLRRLAKTLKKAAHESS